MSRASEVRCHIHQIVTSRAFKKSRRSCEFIQHIADKTLAGELDELKERMIGVQLFGRDPSYDTGEDAIVRVTATDVRRRLKRFYDGAKTDIRLEMPPGSYIIELNEQDTAAKAIVSQQPSQLVTPQNKQAAKSAVWRRFLPAAAAVLALLGIALTIYCFRMQSARTNLLPWSAMMPHQGKLKIVFSDPDIVALQEIARSEISLTDYAGHHYLSAQEMLDSPPGMLRNLFKGNDVPMIDANFALGARELLPSIPIETLRARALQAQDFETEDNFILLGSPLSNPWVALFQDRLDFYFKYDPLRHEEVIYNRHVERGETSVYAPTIPGWGTGQAFAIIGLLANPNQTGHVLILAGSNSVATEAAYRLVTDVGSIVRVLREHGVNVEDRNAQFEILLRVETMASSLSAFDVVACHRLSGYLPNDSHAMRSPAQ